MSGVEWGKNRGKRKVHDETCPYTWKNDEIRNSQDPSTCPYCSDEEWWRDNMIKSFESMWYAHASDHMDTEACTLCRRYGSLIARMKREPFAPEGIMQIVYGAEPYTPIGD